MLSITQTAQIIGILVQRFSTSTEEKIDFSDLCTGPQKEPRGKARTHQPITVPTIHAPSGCHGFPCGRAEAHRSGAKGAFLLVQNVPVSWRTLVCRQITHETYFFCCEDCLLRPDGGLHLENVKSHEQTRPHHCLLKAKKHRTSSYGAPE